MEHMITGHTALYGSLGHPIKHIRSPRMHNLAFARLGFDGVYLAFDVDNHNLEDAVKGLRTLNAQGFQVTMPNKKAVIPLLDELSEEARLIGAVNVVKNSGGQLKGYNTDGMGFVMNLEEQGVEYKGKKAVLLGAGGAGRAVAIQLALSGLGQLAVFNTTAAKATELAAQIAQSIPACAAAGYAMDEARVLEELQSADLLVDCTPLGMAPRENEAPLASLAGVPQRVTVVDIVYDPPQTKLLAMAKANGNRTISGEGMLYCQGMKAFEIFTGQRMPIEYVKANL